MKVNLRIVTALLCVAVVGSAMAQGQRGGGRGFGGRQGGANQYSTLMLINRTDVQEDLKLTDDQKTKLTELRESMRTQGGGFNRGGGNGGGETSQADREAAMKAFRERMAENEKKVKEILTADQVTRLGEIRVQFMAERAILDEDVQKKLNLTDDQKAKIKEANTRYSEAMASVQQKMRNQEIDRTQATEARQTNDKALGEDLKKILTSAQSDQLKTLGGKEFKRDASLDQRRRGGGRNGGGL